MEVRDDQPSKRLFFDFVDPFGLWKWIVLLSLAPSLGFVPNADPYMECIK
jgi:hypothetical protein